MSLAWLTNLAPIFIKLLGPKEFLARIGPGIAKTSLFCSKASLAVIKAPLFSGASITKIPKLKPEMIRLR